MALPIQDLNERIQNAKRVINQKMTAQKVSANGTNLELFQLGRHLDTIHEIERTGLRNLTEVETRRITRVLTSLEGDQAPSDN